jgi:hypothetical protein
MAKKDKERYDKREMAIYMEELASNAGSSPAEDDTKPPSSMQHQVASPSVAQTLTSESPQAATGRDKDLGSMSVEQIAQASSMLQQQAILRESNELNHRYLILEQLGKSVMLSEEARLALAQAAIPVLGHYGLGNPFGMPAPGQLGSLSDVPLMTQAMMKAQDDRILALLKNRNSDQDDGIRAILETRNNLRVLQAAQEGLRQLLLDMQKDGIDESNQLDASEQLDGGLLPPVIANQLPQQFANQSQVVAPSPTATQAPTLLNATYQTSLATNPPSSSTGQNRERFRCDKALAAAAAAAAESPVDLSQVANQSQVSASATKPPASNVTNQTNTSIKVKNQTQCLAARPPSYIARQNRMRVRGDKALAAAVAAAESVANISQVANQSQVAAPSPTATQPPTFTRNALTQPVPEFLWQLFTMLRDENLRNIISWEVPSINETKAMGGIKGIGKIVCHQPDVLQESVLGKYYGHSKYSSFQRQLNNFGFKKRLHGGNKGKLNPCSYVHEGLDANVESLLGLKSRRRPLLKKRLSMELDSTSVCSIDGEEKVERPKKRRGSLESKSSRNNKSSISDGDKKPSAR